jgi:hypothetical protein
MPCRPGATVRITLLLIVLSSVACGPKKPLAPTSTEYFPLAEGARWTYRGSFQGRESIETRHAVPTEIAGRAGWLFLLEEDLDASVAETLSPMFGLGAYRRTASGIETADLMWRSDLKALTDEAFQPMLQLPPVVGAQVVPDTNLVDRSGGWTVAGYENITVPAGSFRECARVELGSDSRAWLCPGVGLVKWVFVTGRVEELTEWSIPSP